MSSAHAFQLAIVFVAGFLIVLQLRRAREARRAGRCVTCGAPAEDGECAACWQDRFK